MNLVMILIFFLNAMLLLIYNMHDIIFLVLSNEQSLNSLHGLIRGENMELGRDSDTGGQVTFGCKIFSLNLIL